MLHIQAAQLNSEIRSAQEKVAHGLATALTGESLLDSITTFAGDIESGQLLIRRRREWFKANWMIVGTLVAFLIFAIALFLTRWFIRLNSTHPIPLNPLHAIDILVGTVPGDEL